MKLFPFGVNPSVSLRGGENRERKGVCGDGAFCPEEYPAGAWRAVGRCFAARLCPRCRGGSDAGTFRLREEHSLTEGMAEFLPDYKLLGKIPALRTISNKINVKERK